MQIQAIFILFSALVTVGFLVLSFRAGRKISSLKLPKLTTYPKVSIIIPAHNKANLINKCIDSAIASGYPNKEIIVVNDCSTDGTGKILEKYKNIKIITNKKRLGKSLSLNSAAAKASDLILFLDADTLLEENTIENLVSSYIAHQSKEGEMLGFVAPKYKLIGQHTWISKLAYLEQSIHQFLIKVQMNTSSILAIRGCCLFINKKSFFSVGGFSNTILEDGDLSAKLAKAGYKNKYEPRTSVWTDEPETLRELFRTRNRYGKGGFFCILNHTKHFLFSRQSILSFYPYVLLSVGFVVLSLATSQFVSTINTSTSFLGILGLASTTGMLVCATTVAKDSMKKRHIALLFLPYIFLYVPFTALGYFKGGISGIRDKIKEHGELKLKDW